MRRKGRRQKYQATRARVHVSDRSSARDRRRERGKLVSSERYGYIDGYIRVLSR